VEKSKIPATGRPIARVVSDAEAQAELLDEDLNLAEMDAGSQQIKKNKLQYALILLSWFPY